MNKINPKYRKNLKLNIEQRGARQKLAWINENLLALRSIRGGNIQVDRAVSLNNYKEVFTPPQLSLVDVLYEKTMEGLGEKSFKPTYKPRRKY